MEKFLLFRLAGYEYVVAVSQVQEIVRLRPLKPVAGAPAYIEGLLKRRGHLVPVVDLRKRLGLPPGPATPETCIILAKFPLGQVGLIADAALELVRLAPEAFAAPSPLVTRLDQPYVQGMAQMGERILVLLNWEKLFTPAEQHALGQIETASSVPA